MKTATEEEFKGKVKKSLFPGLCVCVCDVRDQLSLCFRFYDQIKRCCGGLESDHQ